MAVQQFDSKAVNPPDVSMRLLHICILMLTASL